MATEDVAAAGLAAGHRREDALRDVADIDEVVGTRRREQAAARANLQQHPAARRLPVPRADHVDRIDDHRIEALVDLFEHRGLGLPLRDHVRAFEHAAGRRLFVGRHAVRSQTDRIDARDMDQPRAGPSGRPGHHPCALDVDMPHLLEMPPAAMHQRRGMDDMGRAIDGPLHGRLVVEAGRDHVHREGRKRAACLLPRIGDWTRPLAGPDQHPHVVVAVDQLADNVVTHEARGACDQAADAGRRQQTIAGRDNHHRTTPEHSGSCRVDRSVRDERTSQLISYHRMTAVQTFGE